MPHICADGHTLTFLALGEPVAPVCDAHLGTVHLSNLLEGKLRLTQTFPQESQLSNKTSIFRQLELQNFCLFRPT